MSRMRCIKFFWAKFSRLIRYSSSVQACKLIKALYLTKATKIASQFRVYKLRSAILHRVQHKRALVIQSHLRRVLVRNRMEFL
jgi:hypothetical protein